MIFKVNNIVSDNQARMLKSCSILGVSVSSNTTHPDFLSIDDAKVLLDSYPDNDFSIFLDWSLKDSFDAVRTITERKNVKYIEFECPDFHKESLYKEFCSFIQKVDSPMILRGFFFMKDDLSMLEDKRFFSNLGELGVVYFQFDLESICDSDFMIGKNDKAKISLFFNDIPALVSDGFESLDHNELLNTKGVSLSIKNKIPVFSKDNFKFDNNAFSVGELRRLMR